MSDEEGKGDHSHHLHFGHHHDQQQQQQQPQYGTFEGAGDGGPYHPPPPSHQQSTVMGFPQPVPPPGSTGGAPYYAHGYQAVPGYVAVAEGRPIREPHLPCCGIGLGWFLFIIGFFLAAIPWYIGAFIILCVRRVDHREKPGYVACAIAAVLAAFAIIIGATKGADIW